VIPWCHEHGTGVIVYSPMQAGLLSGSFSRERLAILDPTDWRLRDDEFTVNLDRNLELAEALRPLASAEGRRMVDVVRAIAARGAPTGPVALPSPPVADPRAHTASAWGTRTGKVGLTSRKTLYALGAVGLVVTVAGVAFLLGSGSRRPPPASAPVATAVSVAPTAVASSAPVEPAPRASVEAIPSAPTATSSSPKKRPVPRGPNVDPLKDRR